MLCNNWLGWKVLEWLVSEREDVAAVIVHPANRAKYLKEIQGTAEKSGCTLFDGSRLTTRDLLSQVQSLNPVMAVSVLFGYILRREFLLLFPAGCINLHPALLPYNRGAYPNVWSILDQTPAGVTLHYVDEGVDTGDIIAQREVPSRLTDTGESMYRKLEAASLELFKEVWPTLRSGQVVRRPQRRDQGTSHRLRDVEQVDEIELSRFYKAEDLINLIRARTFKGYPGAYVRHNGRKIYLRLELEEETCETAAEHGHNR
jgi:methionyl-tRNA formyltransferase